MVVAVVETHGRRETAALLAGLEVLPRRRIDYRGRDLDEMDLDALLARRPQLALVDELAHDNAPGSRHPKRWQDVEELLAAGIDVWTHDERPACREPERRRGADHPCPRARDRARLACSTRPRSSWSTSRPTSCASGCTRARSTCPSRRRRALDHYFSPGNLTALRELALRRTAERVDDQMVQYMRAHGLAGPWAASEHLLVCVHGGEGAAELVRYTKRLADRLKAPWTAIHVQTAGDRRAGEAANDRVADTLRLAERLGGETLVLPGQHIAEEMLAWARANNVTQIIIGSVRRSGWRDLLGGSLPRDLIRGADDIVVQVLPEGGETAPPKRVQARRAGKAIGPVPFLVAALLVAAATGAGWLLQEAVDLSTTSRWCSCCRCWLVSLAYGLWPALVAAVVGDLRLQLLLPRPALHAADRASPRTSPACCCSRSWRWWPAGSRRARAPRPLVARQEAARAAALYGFAKKLTGVATIDDLLWAAAHQVALMLKAEVVFLLPEDGRLPLHGGLPSRGPARRQRPRRRRMVLAQRHAGRPRLGQPARRAAPVPPLAHRPRQARRGRHQEGSGRAAADAGRAPAARRAARPDRTGGRPRPARPRRRRRPSCWPRPSACARRC